MKKESTLAKQLTIAIKRENANIQKIKIAIAESEKKISKFKNALEAASESEQEQPLVGKKANYSPQNEILALLKSKEEGCTIQQIIAHLTKNHGNINIRSIRATVSGLKSDRKGPARIFSKKSVSGAIRWFIAPMKQHDPVAEQANLANLEADKEEERIGEEKRQNFEDEQRADRALEDREGSARKWAP